jgi:hypothetical protein
LILGASNRFGASAFIGCCLLAALPATTIAAQTRYGFRLGATAATHLVEDQIVATTSVRQKIAPALAVNASIPAWTKYEADLELVFSTGGSKVVENGVNVDYGSIRTLQLSGGISGGLFGGIRARGSLGVIKYWGSSDQGIFRQGGPLRVIAGVGAYYRYPLRERLDLVADARWDWHRFTTEELKARGFGRSTDVHRLTLSLGISRSSQ